MNKHTYFTSAITAAVAVASFSIPAQAEEAVSHPFTDVSDRYAEAVDFLYMIEVINGVSSTRFGTSQTLTRGDAAVILAGALDLDTENAPDAGFTDVNTRIKGSVNALAEYGIVSGVTATSFKPGEPLSRGAMAKFLVTAFELEGYAVETPFTDAGGVFETYIEALYGTEITSGKTASSYGTHTSITRGEFAVLLYRAIWFSMEDVWYPVPVSAAVTTPTTTQIVLEEAAGEEYAPRNVADSFYFSIEYGDGTQNDFEPTSASLSADRTTLTVRHEDLTGKKGVLVVDDYETAVEAPFDFTSAVVTSSSSVNSLFHQPAGVPAAAAVQ